MEHIIDKIERVHIIILTLEALPIENVLIPQHFVQPERIYYLIESLIEEKDITSLVNQTKPKATIRRLLKLEVTDLLLEIADICGKEKKNLLYMNCFGHQYVSIAAVYSHMLFNIDIYCPKINKQNEVETIISPYVFNNLCILYPEEYQIRFLMYATRIMEEQNVEILKSHHIRDYLHFNEKKIVPQRTYTLKTRLIEDLEQRKLALLVHDPRKKHVPDIKLTEEGILFGKIFRLYHGESNLEVPWMFRRKNPTRESVKRRTTGLTGFKPRHKRSRAGK